MADIKKHTDKIRKAIYGKEVRGALADGIEAINDEVEDNTEVAVNVEQRQDAVEQQFDDLQQNYTEDSPSDAEIVAARTNTKTHENYNTVGHRVDDEYEKTNAQSADKANQSYVDSKVQEVADGAPKIAVATFAELQSNYPNGSEDNAVVSENGHLYNWNGASWVDTGIQYQAKGIADRTVSPNKTTFAVGGGGVNLFDDNYTTIAMSGNSPYKVMDIGGKSAIVELNPSTQYIIWKSDDTDRFRIGFFETYPEVGSVPTFFERLDYTSSDPNYYVYTTSETERYALIMLSSSTENKQPSQFQVEKGNVKSEYVAPNEKIVIDLSKKSIPPIEEAMTTFFKRSEKNLFDGNYYTGYLNGNDPYKLETDGGKYALIEVLPNTEYTISKSDDTDRFRFGTFSKLPKVGDTPTIYERPDNNIHTIKTDESARYLVIVPTSVAQSKEPEWLQVELGRNATTYEPPYILSESTAETNFVIAGNLDANYEVFTTAPVMDSSLNLKAVYDVYDDLVTRYPDYVTRTLLTNETTGLPVYRYDFTPPKTGAMTETLPKILHVNGIHGSEKQSLGSGMRFYADLCDSWQNNELLKVLRWNVHFIVIPAFNAWGVENNSRGNANGVDLNRNFPVDWTYTDDSYGFTSGSEPLTEPESQAMMNLLQTEQNIIFAIDHHRYNSYSQDEYTMWTGTKNDTLNKYLSGWSRDMQGNFVKMHPDLAVGNVSRIKVQESYAKSSGGWLAFSFVDNGITGTILEISLDSELNDFHTNSMGNLFGYAVKNFHNDKSKALS